MASGAAGAPERVAVRAAAHPGFGRLVFEWPAPIEVDSRRAGDRLTLRFARPLAADLAAAAAPLERYLLDLGPGADQREVVLRLAPHIGAKLDVYDERIVAVDLAPEATAGAAVGLRTGSHEGFVRLVLDWSGPIAFEARPEGRRLRLVFNRAGRIDAAAIRERLQPWLDDASSSSGEGRSELRLGLKPGVMPQVFKVGDDLVVVDLHEPAGPATSPAVAARTSPPAPPAPLPEPAAAPDSASANEKSDTASLRIGSTLTDTGAAIDFVWDRPVGAAFLLRAGYLWSVFAAPPNARLTSPGAPVEGYFGPGERIDATGGMAFRFPLRRPLEARVGRDGSRWHVILSARAAPPGPVPVSRLERPARLRFAADEPARLVQLTDPEVGDRLDFWPLLEPDLGQPHGRRLVDLELLATAQGLAWRMLSDRAQSRVVDHAIELLAPDGLLLSEPAVGEPSGAAGEAVAEPTPPPAEAPASAPGSPDSTGSANSMPPRRVEGDAEVAAEAESDEAPSRQPARASPLALAGWALPRGQTPSAVRARLQQSVIQAAPAERPVARLDLARFYLAQGMAAETFAVLGGIGRAAGIALPPSVELARRGLAGAAELLMGRPEEAAARLDAPELDGDPEVALWRAALAAAAADWPRAGQELARSGRSLDDYPPLLQLRLGLPAARIAIETGKDDLAKIMLGRLAALQLRSDERARVDFVAGLALARRGEVVEAEQIWRRLAQSSRDETGVEAAYELAQLQLETGELGLDEALARLAPARALWRGYPSEPRMLDGLAGLYLRSGDQPSAIRTWQDVLVRFPRAPAAERIARTLRETFVAAVSAKDGDRADSLRAYALFRDLPQLVPEGAEGDLLRRRLAQRLAELDLIEPAVELLEGLLGRAGSGAAKAAAGADLAELRLREPQPEAALEALERSRVTEGLPEDLQQRRLLLQARALAALDRTTEALALLDGRSGDGERRLRAGILWQRRDWPRLIDTLEALLTKRPAPQAPLSEEEQDLVLKLALAYGQSSRADALEELRARFGPAMRGAAGEPAFLVATMTAGRPLGSKAVLAVAGAQLGRVRRYLEAAPEATGGNQP